MRATGAELHARLILYINAFLTWVQEQAGKEVPPLLVFLLLDAQSEEYKIIRQPSRGHSTHNSIGDVAEHELNTF